ncbi:MAG: hypothetical protein J0H82_24470 [Alphaproteobacteria bacterium]|jgi:hypothetical protein|nr:hypothetical protein [Alphaproteobacteria bacterium]
MLCCLIGMLAAANVALARRCAAAGIAAALLAGAWFFWHEVSAGDLDAPPICHSLLSRG